MDSYRDRAASYRAKAMQVLTVAAGMNDADAKVSLLAVSEDYLHMAEMLESLAKREAQS